MSAPTPKRRSYQNVGLWLGPLLCGVILALPAPAGLSADAWTVVAIAALLASWWATEALPVPATSLVPLIAFPITGVLDADEAAAPYARPVIFLLLGGFIMAMALQRWGLHRRIALTVVAGFGAHPRSLILGFMAATALISMWISNTATTLMMIPIALSVVDSLSADATNRGRFARCLLLGIAWSASIGGLGTIIGTPPNAFVVGFVRQQTGQEIGFLAWMSFGVPVAAALVPLAWIVLTRGSDRFAPDAVKGGRAVVADQLAALGGLTRPERRVALIFFVVANAWLWRLALKEVPGLGALSDMIIAIAGALAMFLVPAGDSKDRHARLLDWPTAERLPWGVILLFGGGLSLARAVQVTGLSEWLGAALAPLAGLDLFVILLGITLLIIFLTELTSNTATIAALVPILAALADTSGVDPMILAAPAAMAGSAAFMLPVATAPNAIVYATGRVSIPQMARAGLLLNLAGSVAIATICWAVVPRVFG
ncbi:MAG: SLC13 family permease [Rhodothalassiaceae bacterium]